MTGIGLIDRSVGYLRSIRPEHRWIAIVVFWALLFGALIAFDSLFLRDFIDANWTPVADISFYRERTQGMLDGKWLYCDIPCESPPLIVYFMIPAQLLGGGYLAYQIWFSIFELLTALALYFALRRYDDFKAFLVSLMFLLIPAGTVETVMGIQDESIMVFIFIASVLLAILNRPRWSALAIAIGTWTKVFNALFYPILFMKTKRWGERGMQLLIILLVSLVVALPYLIVCPEEFLKFPTYYFLGGGPGPTGGISIWDFLAMGGLEIPGTVFLVATLGALAIAYYIAYKRNMTIVEATLIVLVAFILAYSRLAIGYYMLPIALLLFWAAEDRKIFLRCFFIYVPLILSVPFSRNNPNEVPYIQEWWGWIVGFLLSLTALIILFDTMRVALKRKNFVDGTLLGGGKA